MLMSDLYPISFILVTLLIILSGILFYTLNNLSRKKATIQGLEENLETLRATINDLLTSSDRMENGLAYFEELLKWKFNVMVKIIKVKHDFPLLFQKENKVLYGTVHKIIFSNEKEPLDELINLIEIYCPRFISRLEGEFPNLTKNEVNVCLLTYAGLSIIDICIVLRLSENSIYKIRSSLNKKIGCDFRTILVDVFENEAIGVNPADY